MQHNINVVFKLTPEIVESTILYFLFERSENFKITKESVLVMATHLLKSHGESFVETINKNYNKKERESSVPMVLESQRLGRNLFSKIYREYECQSLTFIKGI